MVRNKTIKKLICELLRFYEMDANLKSMSDNTHFRFTFLTYLAVASERIKNS